MNVQPNRASVRTAVVRTQWEATAAGVTRDSLLTPHRLNVLVRTLLSIYMFSSVATYMSFSLTISDKLFNLSESLY